MAERNRQVIRHWWPDDQPEPWVKCMGRKKEGLVRVSQPGYPHGPVYEHITTRNRMAVNCEACTHYLPEVVALRTEHQIRGAEVVITLAGYSISASYENRHSPMVEMHLDEAEQLLLRIAGLQQAAAQLQGEAELLGFTGPAQPGDVVPSA